MHCLTLEEIKKCYSEQRCLVTPEQTVILEPLRKNGFERKGSFDFLLETEGRKLIGFEVLTRPSRGKLKKKLSYSKEVQEFVFVMPEGFLKAYLKQEKRPFEKISQGKKLPKEFNSDKIQAWLLDLKERKFSEKSAFSKLFNVEKC